MKKLFIGVWHPSVIMTYAGLALSLIGIGMALLGKVSEAMILLVLAALCDMFDGVIARRFKRSDTEKEFGIQIDSLVDVCSFLIFPVCLLLVTCKGHFAAYIVAVIYAVAGVARLGWFNISTHDSPDHFIGLPVTYAALIIPVTHILLSLSGIDSSVALWIRCAAYLLTAVLFICNFKTKKPSVKVRLLLLAVAVALIAALIFIP